MEFLRTTALTADLCSHSWERTLDGSSSSSNLNGLTTASSSELATPRIQLPVLMIKAAVLPFRADRSALDRIRREHPDAVTQAHRTRPGLMVWAATQAPIETVTLLAELGFDVNAYGRGDAPVEQPWETALHQSAGNGNLGLTRRLLELGADPNLRDQRFDATPLDWAKHLDQRLTAALLEPVTATPANGQ